jgi:hypothetical protein
MSWRDTVQKLFRRQAAGQVAALSRGASGEATMPRQIPTTPDSGMSGAYMQLATMLSVDTDLMLRFADYENMDDYGEISCLTMDSPITVLEKDGVRDVPIGELARRAEPFVVMSVDLARKRIVPTWATGARQTGSQAPVFRVTFAQSRANPGQDRKQWSIRATAEHLFMLRDGSYKPAAQLLSGDRLMPISMDYCKEYVRVRDPWASTSSGGTVHRMVHTLVAEELIAKGPIPDSAVVHHKDGNRANPHPGNLEIKLRADHVRDHDVTNRPEVKEKIRRGVQATWANLKARKDRAAAMRDARGGSHPDQWRDGAAPRGILTEEHRKRIAAAHTIPLAHDVVEAALRTSLTMREAHRKLGVSASTLARRMLSGGLSADLLGTSVQTLTVEDAAYENHVVVSVEPDGFADVYDVEVPEYHNFVCNGVVVHNCALDIYADDATVVDTVHGKTIWGTSKDKVIRDIINDLLDRRLHIEDEIWTAIRTLCKYGNLYAEVVANEKGVLGLNWLPPPTVRRIVDQRGTLVGFVQDPSGAFAFNLTTQEDLDRLRQQQGTNGAVFFSPWEVVHWRLRGKQMRALYGFSILDSSRWVWKRLLMLEDSSLVCKLTKAPARFAFYIDTGEIPPREARAVVDDVRRRYKKKRIMDPATGKLDFRFNPLCLSLDTRIPLLNGTTRSLRDLIMDHEAGMQNYVYSMDPETKCVKPGTISWAGVTRRDARVVRVTLDNCRSEVVTPDHQFLMRDGTYKQAQILEPGDSVMPLYRGITAQGYEYAVNQDHRERGSDKWKSLVSVHRMVAEHFHGDLTDRQVHHIDDRKRNNYPENLDVLTPEEHGVRHAGAFAGRMRQWAQENPGVISMRNRERNSGQHIIAYNRSPKHKADNAIRSEKISIKYPDGLLPELRRLVQENAALKISDAVIAIRALPVHEEFRALNANRKKVAFDLYHVRTLIHRAGHRDWQDFCAAATVNHKVASVEWLDGTMDTGCITVDGWHNFAVDAGVFVKNSQDEDIFIPTRAGKDATRVEVLSGPDYDDTGVLGYFLKKLFSSLRIPPQYIGGTEVTNRAALTQEDVQFAKLELRIQREFITGLRQVVRVHLAALNIDPDSVQWNLEMPAPSSIFEMQQVEVWNARAGLAAALQPFFTAPWIMANIFHMSDEDALFAAEAKTHEAEAQALGQASIQAEIIRQFPELGPEGALALGAPITGQSGLMGQPGQPGQEQMPQESIKRIERALHQLQESNDRVTRSVERTDSAVFRIGQRFRAISQTNQSNHSRHESQAR